jgi:molybdopterin-binding protein
MNQLSGTIKHTKSSEGITHIYIEVGDKILSSLILGEEEEYQKDEKVNLLFKETEVMIASKESIVSARNSFISPITYINMGEILAEIHFDFDGIQIVSVVTKGALDDLKCNIGDEFRWFVKSNEVLIARI